METDIFDRYFAGLASEEEKRMIENLIFEDDKDHFLKNYLETKWEEGIKEQQPWDGNIRVLYGIHQKMESTRQPLINLKEVFSAYSKIAAILLLPALLSVIIISRRAEKPFFEEKTHASVYAPLGSRVLFTLPDSTTGMLNSGSTLEYSIPFNSERKVKLTGEAWFDVKHDEKHRFEVKTGNSSIRVLGTSFNLSAYPSENYTEVVLEEGRVDFLADRANEEVAVFPSERLIYNEGGLTKTFADPLKYKAWTEGKLVFRNDPMAEVARRLERWYNVSVIIADKELLKYSFRATFEDDSLEDVLRFLSLTSPIMYHIEPAKQYSDGSIEKEKVKIFRK